MTYFGAVRHPLTENHHVIVDGVHASVHILNEQLYRKLSYPLQLTYWANSEWNRSWLVKKLVRLVQNGKEPFFTSSPTELLEYWTGSVFPGILATFSNEDENEDEDWYDRLGPGTRTSSTAVFRRETKTFSNRLRYVDESLPTVKVTRENVFQRIS